MVAQGQWRGPGEAADHAVSEAGQAAMDVDEALDLLYDECDHYLEPIIIVRAAVAELRAENDRLRRVEQRAREVSEWPDRPEFRGLYANAGIYILGEEGDGD
jgi:hypothetical protein